MSQVQEKVIIVDNPRVIKILKKRFTKQILNCFIDAPKTAAEIESQGGHAIPIQANMSVQFDVAKVFTKVFTFFTKVFLAQTFFYKSFRKI